MVRMRWLIVIIGNGVCGMRARRDRIGALHCCCAVHSDSFDRGCSTVDQSQFVDNYSVKMAPIADGSQYLCEN